MNKSCLFLTNRVIICTQRKCELNMWMDLVWLEVIGSGTPLKKCPVKISKFELIIPAAIKSSPKKDFE